MKEKTQDLHNQLGLQIYNKMKKNNNVNEEYESQKAWVKVNGKWVRNKHMNVDGKKTRFIPASEFNATYHWQKTNKKDGHMIPVHILDRYYAKKAVAKHLAKKMKKNWDNSKKKK